MFTLVVGGAASGKSEYAEQLILRAGALPRYYVATMEPFGAEARARIARHRVLRAQKRFETIECPVGLSRVLLPARGAALLECLSNLAANELYSPAGAGGEQAALAAVVDGVPAAAVRSTGGRHGRGVQRRQRLCGRYRYLSACAGRGKPGACRPGGRCL